MDPCPFVRIVIGNLALSFPTKSNSSSFYCKLKLKGLPSSPSQLTDVSLLPSERDAVESKIHSCFTLSRSEVERLTDKSKKVLPCLKVEVYRRGIGGCGFGNSGKLLGCYLIKLDFTFFFENNGRVVIQNGWVGVGEKMKLHLNVRAEPDPRFVFRFDGEPECSPQVFQVNGNVKQPVFTCKFGMRTFGERNLRSRFVVLSFFVYLF